MNVVPVRLWIPGDRVWWRRLSERRWKKGHVVQVNNDADCSIKVVDEQHGGTRNVPNKAEYIKERD